jgi:hypothetical protein
MRAVPDLRRHTPGRSGHLCTGGDEPLAVRYSVCNRHSDLFFSNGAVLDSLTELVAPTAPAVASRSRQRRSFLLRRTSAPSFAT